jgi:hypothetical protein
MTPGLEEAKARVRRRVLGEPGVHAVGLRRKEDRVVLYADAAGAAEEVLAAAREAAAPYAVVVVAEERPILAPREVTAVGES